MTLPAGNPRWSWMFLRRRCCTDLVFKLFGNSKRLKPSSIAVDMFGGEEYMEFAAEQNTQYETSNGQQGPLDRI